MLASPTADGVQARRPFTGAAGFRVLRPSMGAWPRPPGWIQESKAPRCHKSRGFHHPRGRMACIEKATPIAAAGPNHGCAIRSTSSDEAAAGLHARVAALCPCAKRLRDVDRPSQPRLPALGLCVSLALGPSGWAIRARPRGWLARCYPPERHCAASGDSAVVALHGVAT